MRLYLVIFKSSFIHMTRDMDCDAAVLQIIGNNGWNHKEIAQFMDRSVYFSPIEDT